MIYVILGMHKSGTSLIAKILHHSGINMGLIDPQVDYDSGNKYERNFIKDINKTLLNCRNDFSLSIELSYEDDDHSKEIYQNAKNNIDILNNEYFDWGFKDPRICLTYKFWNSVLTNHRLIYVYRSPFEVWLHYQRAGSPINFIRKAKSGWKSISSWYNFNQKALNILDKTKNEYLLISFNKLMNGNIEFDRLASFINLKLVDCRDKKLYRAKSRKSVFYFLFVWLQKLLFSRDVLKLFERIEKKASVINQD